MKQKKEYKVEDISACALRLFAENRKIANKAVEKAVKENKQMGISDKMQFSQ